MRFFWKKRLTVIPWVIAALCLLECLSFMLYHHASTGLWGFWMPDTQSYVSDGLTLRPLLYPLFLKVCGMSEAAFAPTVAAVTLVPMLVYVVSVAAFTRMAIAVGGWVGLLMSLVYGLCPSLAVLPLEMGTECFSASFVVLAVYMFWLITRSRSSLPWWGLAVMMFLLLAIRPSFLFVPVAVIIVGVAARFMPGLPLGRVMSRKLLLIGCLGVAYLLVYSAGVYCKWGVFTPSTVSVRNDYYEARLAGVLDAGFSPDAELAAAMKQYIDTYPDVDDVDGVDANVWLEAIALTNSYDHGDLLTTINESKKANSDLWQRYFIHKVTSGLSEPLLYPGADKGRFSVYTFRDDTGRFLRKVGVTWWVPLAVSLAVMLLLLWQYVGFISRCSDVPKTCTPSQCQAWLFAMFLTLLLLGNIIIVTFGAPYDFSRLLHPVLPAFLLLCASLPSVMRHP